MNANETTSELSVELFNALCKELGLIEAVREWRRRGGCSGNYTEERKIFLADVTNEDIEREWKALEKQSDTLSQTASC
jgi:hypothetical protein